MHEEIVFALTDKILELIILPTENCNFRCLYCYEKHKNNKIDDELFKGIKKLLKIRAPSLKYLRIGWFGGEPLLEKRSILELCSYISHLQKSNQFSFISNITTNGYLLNSKTFKKLIEAGVKFYQITLDGDQKAHDKTRVTLSGKGTFNRIWENLISAHKTDFDFRITLRIHYSINSFPELNNLLKKLERTFGKDDRFIIMLKAIECWGSDYDSQIIPFDGGAQQKVSEYYIDKFPSLCQRDRKYYKDGICYAAQTNCIIIRPGGRLSKCTTMLEDERNDVGRITKEGFLEFDQEKINMWTKPLFLGNEEYLQCPAKFVCEYF